MRTICVCIRSMYLCLCQAVKEADVRQALTDGARNVEELAERLGVGTGCGGCRELAQGLIDEENRQPALCYAA